MENAGDVEVEEDTFIAGEEGLKRKRSRGVRGMSEGMMKDDGGWWWRWWWWW